MTGPTGVQLLTCRGEPGEAEGEVVPPDAAQLTTSALAGTAKQPAPFLIPHRYDQALDRHLQLHSCTTFLLLLLLLL
jgi:hypothetical protein